METLKEHEDKFWEVYHPLEKESKSGVECPKCKREMLMDNTLVLTSNPPQRSVRCPKCGYKTSIH